MSRVFGIGERSGFQRITKKEQENKDSSKVFCSPKQSHDVVETSGCRAMVALFNANQKDSLTYISTICSARKLRELRLLSCLKDCPQHPHHVHFSPCGHITRLWSGLAEVMK